MLESSDGLAKLHPMCPVWRLGLAMASIAADRGVVFPRYIRVITARPLRHPRGSLQTTARGEKGPAYC